MLQASTLDFLKKLKKNNNREWFDKHKAEYETAREDFLQLVEKLIRDASAFDPAIRGQDAKKCLFRIYRDIRFSKNKTPYKINLSADISPGGKGSCTAGYYIHIQPGGSFLAGGLWQPEPAMLNAIRQEIDYNAKEFRKILSQKDFKKYFGNLSDEDTLKTTPKGYDKTHPELDLLRHKSFIVVHELSDKEVLSKNFPKHCLTVFKAMLPLHAFLRRACD
jgi:uncharacterized protein (TIGR02453 family)